MAIRRMSAMVLGALGVTLLFGGGAYAAAASPCTLLTLQQVGAVLGASFDKAIPAGAKVCEWIATGPSGPNGTKKVELAMVPANEFATRVSPVPAPMTRTPVSGVGDAANYETTPMGGTLSVKKGDSYFILQVRGVPVANQQQMEVTLAQDAVSKL